MIRAVLDANVFVSGILTRKGIPGKILSAWRKDHFQLVASPAILEEVSRVLRYPKIAARHRWTEEKLREFLVDIAHLAMLTPGHVALSVIGGDPSDNRYLECAVEGEAEYIVSGDRHLLELRTYQGIEILTPAAFLEVLS